MEPDDPLGDEAPHSPLLPPDDRLWRHPSEVSAHGMPPTAGRRTGMPPKLWMVATLAGLAGALCAVALMGATGNLRRILRVPVIERVAQRSDSLASDTQKASPEVLAISRRVQSAVVGIEVEIEGIDRRIRGSGVMFRSDGHVLTNHHVVEGATRIVVVTADGHRAEGRLVGADTWSDIAVVKVDDNSTVPVVTMGSAGGLSVGQKVMAMGGPIGTGTPAVEVGVITALGREVERSSGPLLDMIQTSAPVAVTSSGGALVDGTGAVVGITTALGARGSASMATPIDWARAVAEQLLTTGKVVRVWIGVEGSDLDEEAARLLGVEGGAVVAQVRDGSPAGAAGLAADDVITSVDGAPLASMGALRVVLRAHRPGDLVTLTVLRGSETMSMEVKLTERPAQS
ncbi:MAG: S1C family serine protease [Acidimicrobiales bacterium]